MADDHLIPNTTQVPNSIVDLLMPFLNDGEVRVLLYLCRRIYGFQRQSDSVSLDQFVHGIRTDERQLDFGAGISRQGAMNALAVLKAIGIVEQTEGGRGRGNIPVFRIHCKCEMVKWLDLIAKESIDARDTIVQRLDLIRQKSLPYGPFHKKVKNDKPLEEKVETIDLSEKVETTKIKGLNHFSENRASSSLDAPTKPSSTKPRKEKDTPPEKAKDAFSSPSSANADEGTECAPPKKARPTRKLKHLPSYDPGGYEAFITAFPRHAALPEAVKAWDWLKPDTALQVTILADIQQRKAQDKKWAEGFITHPATYLRGERWRDDIVPLKGSQPRASPPGYRTYNVGDIGDDGIKIGKV
jgi:hypothetical protein